MLGAVYLVLARPGYLTSVEYLGGLLLLEILAAIIWNYRQMFFPVLILTFLFAGTAVPMQAMWTSARWLVLGAGVLAAVFIYLRDPFHSFGSLHLTALFCAVAAATSAFVSPYPKHALLKALSLLLLFAYGSFGSRLAVQGREEKFFSGLLVGGEALIYFAAVEYFIFHHEFFGNPNSLGAIMGVVLATAHVVGSPRKRKFACPNAPDTRSAAGTRHVADQSFPGWHNCVDSLLYLDVPIPGAVSDADQGFGYILSDRNRCRRCFTSACIGSATFAYF